MATKNKHLVLWLIGFLILICAVTTASILMLVDSGPTLLVNNDSERLKRRVSGGIKDAPGSEGLVMDPSDLPPLSSDLAASIAKRAEDDAVKGLFLEIDQVGMGWAQVESLRRSIATRATPRAGSFEPTVRSSGPPRPSWPVPCETFSSSTAVPTPGKISAVTPSRADPEP